MNIKDFDELEQSLSSLGITKPVADLHILPLNLLDAKTQDEFQYATSSVTLMKLLRLEGIIAVPISSERLKVRKDFDASISLPMLLFGLSLLTDQPELIELVFTSIRDYADRLFVGYKGGGRVKLSCAVETKKKGTKRIDYDGPVEGLDALPKIIRALKNE